MSDQPVRRFSIEVSEVSAADAGRLLFAGTVDVAMKCKATGNYTVQATRTSLEAARQVLLDMAGVTPASDHVRLGPGWNDPTTKLSQIRPASPDGRVG